MSNEITSGYDFLERQVFIDHDFLCFVSRCANATGLGSIKTPDHPSFVSKYNELERSSPSNAPASTKNLSLFSSFDL